MLGLTPRHCPLCGTALDTRQADGRDRPYCPSCEQIIWRNADPLVTVVVRDRTENAVLFVQRTDAERAAWSLPGGHLEVEEAPADGAVRELRAETGVTVASEALELFDADSLRIEIDPDAHDVPDALAEDGDGPNYRHFVRLHYLVDRSATVGTPEAGTEATAVSFRALDDIDAGDEPLESTDRPIVERVLSDQ